MAPGHRDSETQREREVGLCDSVSLWLVVSVACGNVIAKEERMSSRPHRTLVTLATVSIVLLLAATALSQARWT